LWLIAGHLILLKSFCGTSRFFAFISH
jgi:hypothetical protein